MCSYLASNTGVVRWSVPDRVKRSIQNAVLDLLAWGMGKELDAAADRAICGEHRHTYRLKQTNTLVQSCSLLGERGFKTITLRGGRNL